MEKINWPQILVGFLFSVVAVVVGSMILQKKNYNSNGQLTGFSKPSLNVPGKRPNQMKAA